MKLFRNTLLRRVPWWLRGTHAGAVLYAIGLQMDRLQRKAVSAVWKRFPGYRAPHDALELHGRERRIVRGLYEPAASYAVRLAAWLDAHAYRGGPYAMLGQLYAFYKHFGNFPIELVYRSGRRFTLAVDGSITYDDVTGWDFEDGPDNAERWARWCLILRPSVDIPLSDDEIARVPREFNAAHCEGFGTILVLVAGAHVWNEPGLTWDADGIAWGDGSKIARVITGV